MAIKTIIFDIGNVLTQFSWERHFKTLGFEGEVFERVANATVKSPIWGEFDRGVPDSEILAAFIERDPGMEEQIRLMFSNISGTLSRCDYAIPWIMQLKKEGYRVLILSNLSSKTVHECYPCLDFMNYVDGGILSYMEGVVKPEREIYERLIERYFIKPSEAVFLDDTVKNIDMAIELGLRGIVFKDYDQASKELADLLLREK
ncbi:MAG: HAD family phosphatase [Lachnospiraceae bacterium]|nr:HAD family phosphatase [Lachnospiraceae bacterium]